MGSETEPECPSHAVISPAIPAAALLLNTLAEEGCIVQAYDHSVGTF